MVTRKVVTWKTDHISEQIVPNTTVKRDQKKGKYRLKSER